jgi:hypothetical protein
MHKKPPQPLVQAFLVCQQIFTDSRTGNCILVAPINLFRVPSLPSQLQFSVYTHLMELHGTYQLEMILRDSHDDIVARWRPEAIRWTDRLLPYRHTLHDATVPVQRLGKYYLELHINGEEAARQAMWVSSADSRVGSV